MNKQQTKQPKNAGPSHSNDEEEASSSLPHLQQLTINDHKSTYNDSDLYSIDKDHESCLSSWKAMKSHCHKKTRNFNKKEKLIQKAQKESQEDKKHNLTKKRRIAHLQHRVEELEKQIQSLRRNQHYCLNCRERLPEFYRGRICELIQTEEPAPGGAGCDFTRSHSKDTLEFEKIDFHTHLMQTQEMEEKMWIFLGTMLIAMGSKVTDFDGTINTFKVMKDSVDKIRRQVQKGETFLGLDFFCSKEELHQPGSLIDGINFDPFYNNKEDPTLGHFSLDGVKMESVEQYELFYDFKYNFNIKYDALLTIMEYARDNCTLS